MGVVGGIEVIIVRIVVVIVAEVIIVRIVAY